MTIEGEEDVQGLERIGQIVARCRDHMLARMEPGMTTAELDAIGESFLTARGAVPAPRATYGFPGATCVSVNEEVAHGVPGARTLREGDLVNVDVSASLDGYYADTGASAPVGRHSARVGRLCAAGREALKRAMAQARGGKPMRAVGRQVERVAAAEGFGVIQNLASHGVGRALHEEPASIPTHHDPHERRRFHRGMVITLEPFLTTGGPFVIEGVDGWTLLNAPGSHTVQYEHTLIVTRRRPIVTTR